MTSPRVEGQEHKREEEYGMNSKSPMFLIWVTRQMVAPRLIEGEEELCEDKRVHFLPAEFDVPIGYLTIGTAVQYILWSQSRCAGYLLFVPLDPLSTRLCPLED